MLKDNLKAILKEKKITQMVAAEKLGITQGALNLYLSGKRRIKSDLVENFSRLFNIPIGDLYTNVAVDSVPVIGYVQAGFWQEANMWDQEAFYSINPPKFGDYTPQDLFALEIRGDSMDKLYPEGTCIVCVPFAKYKEPLINGKKVVCQRVNPLNGAVEATVKEYQKGPKGIVLVPHSTNPIHQPIYLNEGAGDTTLIAVVVGSFRFE